MRLAVSEPPFTTVAKATVDKKNQDSDVFAMWGRDSQSGLTQYKKRADGIGNIGAASSPVQRQAWSHVFNGVIMNGVPWSYMLKVNSTILQE